MDINDISKPELRNLILNLPDGRLKDYYRDFVIYHERVILNFGKNNYADMPMREAVTALCKALFHEVFGAEADAYYKDCGVRGNRFILSETSDPSSEVFCFKGKAAYKKTKSSLTSSDFLPNGELLQIAAAIASKKGFSQYDYRYGRFKAVQDSVHAYTSNDWHHVSADIDKSRFSLTGRISDYESFVFGILCTFSNDFTLPLLDYIPSATKVDFGALRQSEEEMRLLANETTISLIDVLNEEVNSLYPSPLVLFSPTNVDSQILHGLARIPWNLIITFEPNKKDEKHLISVIEKDWKGIRPLKIGEVVGNGRDETAVIFANGESANESKSKYKEWASLYRKKVESALNQIRKGAERVIAVCITDSSDSKIFNRGSIELLKEDDTAVIIGKIGPDLKEGLEDEFPISKYQNFDISMPQCAYVFNEIDIPGMNGIIKVSANLSAEDIKRYASYGIKIICPLPSGTEKEINPISEFFSGREITEKDLYNDFDVRRNFYESFRRIIETRLENGNRFTHYLQQTPSCGATTVAMRLAYDIAVLSERGHFKTPVTSIYISELKTESIKSIVERIKDLALKISPNQILAVIDRSIQSTDFERIKENLTDVGSTKISFIRISEKEKGTDVYTSTIDDVLTKTELPDFIKGYRRHSIVMSNEDGTDWNSLKHIIEFPLSLSYSDGKNIGIKEYVDNVLGMFSDTNRSLIRKLISLIGFSSEYIVNTDNYVEGFLFDGVVGKRFIDWYKDDLTSKERNAFERLVKFEEIGETERQRTGRVKTRFSKYNKDVIKISNVSLTELAIEYIKLCFTGYGSPDELLNPYVINLFFKKEEYEDDNSGDFGKSEKQKFYKKLSAVFNDIKDPDSIELIIEELGEFIGDNPRYLLAKAQYIYNRAYFIDSEEHDSKIFDDARDILERLLDMTEWIQDNETITLQSLGVLNFRRLGALRKIPSKNDTLIPMAERYVEATVKYCDRAYRVNPYETYALVTKAQALKSFLNQTRDILGYEKNDFKFCESDKYLEWTSQYEDSLGIISGFVSNIDKDNATASQNRLMRIYGELREFEFRLIGESQEFIYNLYRQELSSHKIGNELKKLYANRLYYVLVDAPNNEIRNETIGKLSDEKLDFIERQLFNSIRLGNLTGYEKIFRLHLFNGRIKYEIAKERQWLKDWIDKDESPMSQLWGNYYIGTLYFCEILLFGSDQKGFKRSAEEYISESERIADILKRDDTKEFFYFRRDNSQQGKGVGLQCVTENPNKATYMEGSIIEIMENRKGKVKLDCGLEATFAPKGKFLKEDADKHTRIRAKVGFRFSGLGLYGVERIEDEPISDYIPDKTISDSINKDESMCGKKEDLTTLKNDQVSEPQLNVDNEEDGLEEGYIYPGIYHKDRSRGQYITGNWKEKWIKYLEIEGPIEKDIYDGAEIEFEVKKSINQKNGEEKWIAFNVKFPEE
ncbi:MAG: hypothetical protein K2N09_08980 [Muribaculaceae bacterium]|nr:hypothetical protein [Muribaculaceae bacterium]